MLNILMPGYGANHEVAYNNWLKSAEQMPAVIDFDLRPISEIFSADKAAAVEQAINAYVLHKLFVESKTGSCLIAFNGAPVIPPATGDAGTLGYQLAAINRTTLKPEFSRSYTTYDIWLKYEQLYDNMLFDIERYNNDNYIIAFVAFSNFAQNAPTKQFVAFLESCGAGWGLAQWIDTKVSNTNLSRSCALCHTNYVFVGIPKSRERGEQWYESFQRAGSCDTSSPQWHDKDGWLDKPAPMASLMVDLYQTKKSPTEDFVVQLGPARKS
jgi:hypothetical protein